MRRVAWLLLAGVAGLACGHHNDAVPTPKGDAAVSDAAVAIEVPPRPLGLPDLEAYDWRKRAGQPAYRAARKAEGAEQWPTVVATCKQALAADPTHLEAAWLLAAGLGKLGKPADVLAPLVIATSGDFGKWGPASLELPALQPFLGTPIGQAWRRRVELDRATYSATLAHTTIVRAGGDLYAVDVSADAPRWYRITRTFGAVIGALEVPAASRIAFVTRSLVHHETHVALGIVDLTRGHSTPRPVDVGTTAPFVIAWAPASAQLPAGFWIGTGATHAMTWRVLDDDAKFHAVPAKTPRPAGPWLEVSGGSTRLHRLPVDGVGADWDDQSLASAIRLGATSRVVSVPSPGLIDGNTVTWSPDRSHLAFVAQLDEHCTPGAISAAAFVADAATGTAKELERAAGGLAVAWLSDRRLAIAGDHGVTIVDLDGAHRTPLAGATNLVATRRAPRCTPAGATAADDAISDEPDESAVGDDATDAGAH